MSAHVDIAADAFREAWLCCRWCEHPEHDHRGGGACNAMMPIASFAGSFSDAALVRMKARHPDGIRCGCGRFAVDERARARAVAHAIQAGAAREDDLQALAQWVLEAAR